MNTAIFKLDQDLNFIESSKKKSKKFKKFIREVIKENSLRFGKDKPVEYKTCVEQDNGKLNITIYWSKNNWTCDNGWFKVEKNNPSFS